VPFSTGNGVGRRDRRLGCAATSFSSLTLDIGDQFRVEASTDNQTWTTVLREGAAIGDLSNRTERTLDLNALRNGGRTVYIRMGDSQPPTVGEAGSRA
jgi:hypothetical protein